MLYGSGVEALLWGSMDAVIIHGYSSYDRLVTALPLCYTGGLNVATSLAHAGAELILADSAHPAHLLELIATRRATIFHGVPNDPARQRMVSSYDHDVTEEEWALGYRWDIVLHGPEATPFDERWPAPSRTDS